MHSAESAYLFRHALLRDAAYQLQLPGDRKRLHRLALDLMEDFCGGRAPEPPPLAASSPPPLLPHATDTWAEELVTHAHAAGDAAALRLYLRRAAEYRERRFLSEEAARLWARLAEEATGAVRGEALRRAGGAFLYAGHAKLGEPMLEEALALQRSDQTVERAVREHLEGLALAEMGGLYRQTGRSERAVELFGEAAECLRRAGNRVDELRALDSQGCAAMEVGRVDVAESLLDKARKLAIELGLQSCLGGILTSLATLFLDTARRPEAEHLFREALPILRALHDRRNEGVALSNLANIHRDSGRFEDADRLYTEALSIATETGSRRSEGVLLGQRAAMFHLKGRRDRAASLFLDSLSIHREVGNRRFEGIVTGQLANLHLELGRTADAERGYAEAIAIHREVGNSRSEGVAIGNLARLNVQAACVEQGLAGFREAIEIHRRVGNRRFEGIHTCERALALLAVGQSGEARETWHRGAGILRDLGETRELENLIGEQREVCAKAGVEFFEGPPATPLTPPAPAP